MRLRAALASLLAAAPATVPPLAAVAAIGDAVAQQEAIGDAVAHQAHVAPAPAALPTFAAVRAAHVPSDVTVTDRHGEPIQTVRVDPGVRRLAWVPLAEMSPALLEAIVKSEDRRFWAHGGVDWAAVATSAWANAWNTRTRGASTLTMQLAGLIDDGLARPAGGRTAVQKLGQALTALQLEGRWTKSEMLEAYLNSVPFRGELVGIGALSQTLFGKHPDGLDAHEAALAAALVRAPNARREEVVARACGIARLEGGDCTGLEGLAAMALARAGGPVLGPQIAPHVARRLVAAGASGRTAGASVRSTLDASLQRLAIALLRSQLAELAGRDVEDGAVVVLDNATGEVLAWVGSSAGTSAAADVDGVLARRQPGSTIKPFAYALAFERRLLTPASLLDDSPAQIATAGGLYLPQNYDRAWKGWVSARTALGASLNVPAVRVGALLGPDGLHARLQALGFDLPEPAGYYGHALVLGSADVTLLALTNAYRALANGGRWSAPLLAPAPPSAPPARSRRVYEPGAAWLVADILADDSARVRTFGFDSHLATRGWAAVKTGTSKDMRDNWCVGFTDRYTVGVWIGNASGAPMHAVSGVSGAAPVWQALVRHLHAREPSRGPAPPAGVERQAIRYERATEPPREEWFLVGTGAALQRAGTQLVHGRRYGISSPRDGSLFAIDPDMPPAAQRIAFEGEPGAWMLDGRPVGRGSRVLWAPWPGRHRLTLLGTDGAPVETVAFEVRGAGVKAAGAAVSRR